MVKKIHTYERVGHWWYVYTPDGSKLNGEAMDFEECKKEVYRINGWIYKEPENKQKSI